jgi:hypothetical protein
VGWGDVLGRLSALYPHLVCLEIDDFTHDVAPDEHGIFTPHVLARMQAHLHRHSSTFNWAGNVYFSEEGAVAIEWPDLSTNTPMNSCLDHLFPVGRTHCDDCGRNVS